MEVREVRPDEYAEAGRVTALAYSEFADANDEGWDEYLQRIADVAGRVHRTPVLVAVEDGRILGTATLELDARVDDEDPPLRPGEAHLRMVGVDPNVRRRGAGRALVEASMSRARAAGRTTLGLRTTPKMTSAHRMYESMGFRLDPSLDWEFDNGFRLIGYSIEL